VTDPDAAPDLTGLACPACRAEQLEYVVDRGVAFVGCQVCWGLLVFEEDLRVYVLEAIGAERAGKAFDDLLAKALGGTTSRGRKRQCPFCAENLTRLGFGEAPFVILDRCSTHGLWLDDKELRKVVRACRAECAIGGVGAESGRLRRRDAPEAPPPPAQAEEGDAEPRA